MATTIVPSDLTVTITESYSLNGVAYGNTMNKAYTSNGQVSQRIMTITANTDRTIFVDILALGLADGQGEVVKLDYKYFRITNLDTTNTLYFRVYNGTDFLLFEVAPASSFVLMNAGTDSPATGTTIASLADIQAIAGQSSSVTESIDVEFIMVTA